MTVPPTVTCDQDDTGSATDDALQEAKHGVAHPSYIILASADNRMNEIKRWGAAVG